MKKTFFAVCAVLLALLLFSCDAIVDTDSSEPVEYTADGRPLVSLTIGTSRARALTTDLAKAGADFYEVTFFDGTDYYRASWDFTKTGRIKIPAGTYATSGEAVLFVGSRDDKTLLAVGIITTPGDGVITPAMNSITFTLAALTTDVKADPASTFKITADKDVTTYPLTAAYSSTNFPKARLDGKVIPMFVVPKDDSSITATFSIGAGGGDFTDYSDGMYILPVTAPAKNVYSKGISSMAGDAPVEVTASFATLAAGDNFPADGVIDLDITTPDEDGLSRIAIELPVCAIATDADPGLVANPITWYIRGGLQNGLFDEGAAKKSIGGAILLGIGAVTSYDIVIAPVWVP